MKIFENPASDLSDHATIVDDEAMFHGPQTLMRPGLAQSGTVGQVYGGKSKRCV
jgi:hypothetical protein